MKPKSEYPASSAKMIITFGLESVLLEQESNIEIHPKIRIIFFIKIQIYQDYFLLSTSIICKATLLTF